MTEVEEPIAQAEVFADGRLVVWSPKESRSLYLSGFYGKPLGIAKPKEDFDAPLILDPIEGLYLLERGVINLVSGEDGKEVTREELKLMAKGILDRLEELYSVYSDLRGRGFVVAPGIKYGCDFAVYEHGPGIDHAPYIVQVKGSSDGISASDLVEAGRLATTVRKTFIIAMVGEGDIRYLSFKWWRP